MQPLASKHPAAPWERFAAYDAAITKLDNMMDALKLGLDEGDKEEWPTLAVLGNTIEQSEVCRKHDILLQIRPCLLAGLEFVSFC